LMKVLKIVLILLIIYWLPFLSISVKSHPQKNIERLPVADTVIVFGTLVRNANVSALLKERLDASIAIYNAQKAKQIVVSNMASASATMRRYLIANGIPPKDIASDISAEKTPDTCRYEKRMYPQQRKLIFVSQGYHLPRISYQCNKLGVLATTFPAESINKYRASLFSSWEVFMIRVKRYFREAGLTWLALLNIYR
ncbi:MAG TPA: YdcF family protein, partial [Leucothrix sp.]|nr:YdcF family protein [Leucothrix sp.]